MKSSKGDSRQRSRISNSPTRKCRSPTSQPHKGSRVDPSFVHDRKLGERLRNAAKGKNKEIELTRLPHWRMRLVIMLQELDGFHHSTQGVRDEFEQSRTTPR